MEKGSERQKLEHRKFFENDQNIESQKDQNIESQKDQNIESIFRTSKMTYLWRLGLPNLT